MKNQNLILIKKYKFNLALTSIWSNIHGLDKYIDETKPWLLAKNGRQKKIDEVVYNLLNMLHGIAWLIYPFLPETSEKIAKALDIKSLLKGQSSYKDSWTNVKSGTEIKKIDSLFPRLD